MVIDDIVENFKTWHSADSRNILNGILKITLSCTKIT